MHDFKLLANDEGDNVNLPQLHDSHCKHFILILVSRAKGEGENKNSIIVVVVVILLFVSLLCGAAIFSVYA